MLSEENKSLFREKAKDLSSDIKEFEEFYSIYNNLDILTHQLAQSREELEKYLKELNSLEERALRLGRQHPSACTENELRKYVQLYATIVFVSNAIHALKNFKRAQWLDELDDSENKK